MAWSSWQHLAQTLSAREGAQLAPGGHWLWTPDLGWRTPDGVPMATVAGRAAAVRRALWAHTWGKVPSSVRIVAHCVEPACVRPAHGHCGPAAGRHARAEYLAEDYPALAAWFGAGPGVRPERRGRTTADGRRFDVALGLTRPHLLEDPQSQDAREQAQQSRTG